MNGHSLYALENSGGQRPECKVAGSHSISYIQQGRFKNDDDGPFLPRQTLLVTPGHRQWGLGNQRIRKTAFCRRRLCLRNRP